MGPNLPSYLETPHLSIGLKSLSGVSRYPGNGEEGTVGRGEIIAHLAVAYSPFLLFFFSPLQLKPFTD